MFATKIIKHHVYFLVTHNSLEEYIFTYIINFQVVLTCETASSNPEATILWWKDGESITGTHDGVLDAANGGKSTRNKVKFNVTSSDDMSSYTCQATNHLLKKTVHDNFSLRVLCKYMISFLIVSKNKDSQKDNISINVINRVYQILKWVHALAKI